MLRHHITPKIKNAGRLAGNGLTPPHFRGGLRGESPAPLGSAVGGFGPTTGAESSAPLGGGLPIEPRDPRPRTGTLCGRRHPGFIVLAAHTDSGGGGAVSPPLCSPDRLPIRCWIEAASQKDSARTLTRTLSTAGQGQRETWSSEPGPGRTR